MSAHTEGRWQFNGNAVSVRGRGVVAIIPSPQTGGVFEMQANARLIAAAPDLAKEGRALRAFMQTLADALGLEDDTSIEFTADDKTLASVSMKEVFERWDAAIAAAKGEQ